ncbi:MAG: 3'-5' exonuclease [Campylobacterota bacterium]|nr:3'-5' exonuclease [Campylobacterota bacterium]
MAKYIILDTETTGTDENDRIIQLGYMVLDAKSVTPYNEFCSSEVPISLGAMEVHNITPEMIEGKPTCKECDAYKTLLELNTPDNYLIAHNLPFDLKMLEREGFVLQMQSIDTLRCAKHIFDEEPYHRLQYFRYKLGLYKDEEAEAQKLGVVIKAHDAIGDVLTLKLFLSVLRKEIQEKFPSANPIAKMVELTSTPVLVKSFKFGKHKGKKIEDVAIEDSGYLRWMLSSMDNLDDDLRYSIEQVLN